MAWLMRWCMVILVSCLRTLNTEVWDLLPTYVSGSHVGDLIIFE